MRVSSRRKQLSGSKPFEALGENSRVAGIDPARKAARDALTVAIRHAFRADPFEPRNPCQMLL